jgi:hypothetical protein
MPNFSRLALIATSLATFACAGSFEEARVTTPVKPVRMSAPLNGIIAPADRAECVSLDSSHRIWGGLAKGAAVAAAGLGALEVPDLGKDARIGIGASAIGVGAIAAASVFISEDAAASWARDCR